MPRSHRHANAAFTLIELLVVISIIALLVGLLLPALGTSREVARQLNCGTNMRNVSLSGEMFANDHDGYYPARGGDHWPADLAPYYQVPDVLICPTDPDDGRATQGDYHPDRPQTWPRSFMINGWNDVYKSQTGTDLPPGDGSWAMKRSLVKQTSSTVLLGEKVSDSQHFYMDLLEGVGNHHDQIEHSRHLAGGGERSGDGTANYAMVDGSVRNFRFPDAYRPQFLWAVDPFYRETDYSTPQ
jgi:prepilin-type N-terminal cleavage/methylation domain-containing protein/prepilin-type processing-associated H-X9-DG protein